MVWLNAVILRAVQCVISCGICKTEVDVSQCLLSLLLEAVEPETLQAALSLGFCCVLSATETQYCYYLTCGVGFRVLLILSKPIHSTVEKQQCNLAAFVLQDLKPRFQWLFLLTSCYQKVAVPVGTLH